MLPSSRRIPRKLFIATAKGVFFNSKYVTLKCISLGSVELSRCSVSVSKKISKSAVIRNKVRRRVYSVLKNQIDHIKPGFLLYLQTKKGIESASFEGLNADVTSLLQGAKLISF